MKLIITCTFLILQLMSYTQNSNLIVKGVSPNLYLVHKVVPKENWFSVGRLYNVNPKDLAKYNNLNVEKGLAIAQMIKVPLNDENLLTSKIPIAAEDVTVPLYHTVAKSEGLYRIATNAGTTMQNIRAYNNLSSDALSTGKQLIIGYIKVKKYESALASAATTAPDVATKEAPEAPVKDFDKPIVIVTEKPAPVKEVEKPIVDVKEKIEPVKKDWDKPVGTKETPKAPVPDVMEKPEKAQNNETVTESYYKNEYAKMTNNREVKMVNGLAGTFKTMAGWSDNKFYVLIDGVTPGNIIQITNPKNNKSIYAKVLGEMQELRQNHGLKIRLSNAGTSALDAEEESFEVQVKY
jgi:LysM repeat protein